MNNDLEIKLKELRRGYLAKLKPVIEGFSILLNKPEQLNVDELYSKVHTISGTSGMYNLKELSELSNDFELYLKNIKDNTCKLKENELKEWLEKYIKKIEKTILLGE